MAKVYTKGGDKGTTSLLSGARVTKDHARVNVYGNLDELQAQLGIARVHLKDHEFAAKVYRIQEDIYIACAEFSWAGDVNELKRRINAEDITRLEQWIDQCIATYDMPDYFIIPGECLASAALHVSRTVCRRSERLIVGLSRDCDQFDILLKYFNRLSDLLFALAWGVEVETKVTAAVIDAISGDKL